MDEFELFADEFTPPRGDCPRFLVYPFFNHGTDGTHGSESLHCYAFLPWFPVRFRQQKPLADPQPVSQPAPAVGQFNQARQDAASGL
jgi:hypothetical protein